MKKRLFVTAVFSLVVVFLGSSIVFALSHKTTAQDNTQTTAAPAEDTAKLKQRIEERKTRLQTRLDASQSSNLATKCGGAQGKLNAQVARFENSDKPYRAKYDNYLQRLENLQTRLKQNNTDNPKLDEEIVVLKQKIQTLKTSVDQFVQAVNDARSLDCKNDPAGFRAALDDAKNNALALKTARADLEKYARETIKITIEEIKAQRKTN